MLTRRITFLAIIGLLLLAFGSSAFGQDRGRYRRRGQRGNQNKFVFSLYTSINPGGVETIETSRYDSSFVDRGWENRFDPRICFGGSFGLRFGNGLGLEASAAMLLGDDYYYSWDNWFGEYYESDRELLIIVALSGRYTLRTGSVIDPYIQIGPVLFTESPYDLMGADARVGATIRIARWMGLSVEARMLMPFGDGGKFFMIGLTEEFYLFSW